MSDVLVKVRRQAEKAVEDMKDGPLKEKAFETILSHLLSGKHALADSSMSGAVPRAQKSTAVQMGVLSASRRKAGPMGRVGTPYLHPRASSRSQEPLPMFGLLSGIKGIAIPIRL